METLFYNQVPAERGWEYKSSLTLFGLPFLHISLKIRANRTPVVARGIIAVGQFAAGFLAIGQFTAGAIAIGQFSVGVFALGQFALAYSLYAMLGLFFHEGHGPFVRSLASLLHLL